MARAETVAAVGRDRNFLCQQPLPLGEDLQCTRFFGLASCGVVAAGDEDHRAIIQPDAHLMRVDAGIDQLRRAISTPGVASGLIR